MLRAWLVMAMMLAALTGCSGGLKVVTQTPSAPPAATAIFVYPVRLPGSTEPESRSQELAQRLISTGLSLYGDRVAFFGPTEFSVMKPELDAAWVGSTALPLLLATGAKAEQGLVLRAVAERRVTSGTQETSDKQGKARARGATEDVTWVCRVEVLHPSSSLVLVEASGEVAIDPFAEPGPEADFDPAPPLTHLLERLTEKALQAARGHLADREGAPLPQVELALSPASLVGFRADDPGAMAGLLKLDAMDAELAQQARARFLTPTVPEKLLARLGKERPGLLVVSAPEGAVLKAGDFVEAVDGHPALPQSIVRARFQLGGASVRVRHQDGSTHELPFP